MNKLDDIVITAGLAHCTNPLTGEREYDALIVLRVQETYLEITHSLTPWPNVLPDRVQAAIQREAEEKVFTSDYNPFG